MYLNAQESLSYQKPAKEILDLVDVELAPRVRMDDAKKNMVLLYRNPYKTIEELSQEEMRLGGLRIDPKTNIGSRVSYYNNLKVKRIGAKGDASPRAVSGLPTNARLTNFSWSPDQTKMAFTNTAKNGLEVWVLDVKKASVKKLTEAKANANMRSVFSWFEDSKALLVKMVAGNGPQLINTEIATPTGPTVTIADGKKAQNRTYQDLLQNPNDEHNFEQLATSEIHRVDLNGKSTLWLGAAMYNGINFSPDGNYIMVSQVKRPFSYIVPYRRFASQTDIYDKDGKLVKTISELPLIEDIPKGFMSSIKQPRSFRWRGDKPASYTYAVALDGGDANVEADFRDEVFQVDAPFREEGHFLLRTINRFNRLEWINDDTAIATDFWWNTRNTKSYLFNPSDSKIEPKVISDRNYQDRYSDPGYLVTERNEWGTNVVAEKDGFVYLLGEGHSEKGQFPFLDKMNLSTLEKERVFQSTYTDKLEELWDYNIETNELAIRLESPSDYPNYHIKNLSTGESFALTNFENPFKSIQDVHKEVITYKRDDGLELSGTLYLPLGYSMDSKEKMPMILWAYPREFKDKASAAQNTKNPNAFTYPYYGSPIYWVTRGYVVLDGAAFPIVGEGDEEPNDSFRKQLVANAKAAIDAVDAMGYIDRNRVGVGGHSYGAFMVANLLSHSDLFAAGIARSGAYNRTLTPFGFQSEERSYWEAPEIYYEMSPFMHADKMKTPLLLIHGEADNNSGTYPLQSQRYFNALKGLGSTVRLVMLPKESHGYRAKESILHLLWEQDTWLEEHVKNRKVVEEIKGTN